MMAATMSESAASLEAARPVALPVRIIGGISFPFQDQYDVSPDGRFLINVPVNDATPSPIALVLNWKPPK